MARPGAGGAPGPSVSYTPSQLQRERPAYRRQYEGSVVVARRATLVLGVVLVVAITGSPGWTG